MKEGKKERTAERFALGGSNLARRICFIYDDHTFDALIANLPGMPAVLRALRPKCRIVSPAPTQFRLSGE